MGELFDALRAGDPRAVHRLLAARPGLASERTDDGVSAVLWALYVGEPVLAEHVARAKGGLDVFEAASLGELAVLRTAVERDATLVGAWSPDGWTPLHLAAFFGQPEAARLLLAAGADVHAISRNDTRLTPLHSAAAGRRPRAVSVLIEAGADVHARQNGGWTALHSAAQNGDVETARLLLAAGADPAAGDENGRTPADLASGDLRGRLGPASG